MKPGKLDQEQVLDCMFTLMKKEGYHAISPTRVAAKLKSTAEEVRRVMESFEDLDVALANRLLQGYVEWAMKQDKEKLAIHLGTGIAFFARDEPHLFRAFDHLVFAPDLILGAFDKMGKMIEPHPFYDGMTPEEKRELRSVRLLTLLGMGKLILSDTRVHRSDEEICQEVLELSELLKAGILARRQS